MCIRDSSGALGVSGPGLVIELDDGEVTDPEDDAARVQDIDLQIVTNGLWAAGAEAIAINGSPPTGSRPSATSGRCRRRSPGPLRPTISPSSPGPTGSPPPRPRRSSLIFPVRAAPPCGTRHAWRMWHR